MVENEEKMRRNWLGTVPTPHIDFWELRPIQHVSILSHTCLKSALCNGFLAISVQTSCDTFKIISLQCVVVLWAPFESHGASKVRYKI